MFSISTDWYDLIYGWKDYDDEVERITALLRELHPEARTLLDVACGTGEHARRLAASYEVDGLDLEEAFLEQARAKHPAGTFTHANMADFDLGRRYDVIVCLFSSIGYLLTIEEVERAFTCFARHAKPGAVILVEPWFTPEDWKPGDLHLKTAEDETRKVCRMNISAQEGNHSVLEFHYLFGTPAGVEHRTERHELGLYTREEMLAAFAAAGLDAHYEEQGITHRGLYVVRAPVP